MRLWSVHPKFLDAKGLVALWREGLLAQHVLAGKTKGYKNHPQLERFKKVRDPLAQIGSYLSVVVEEAIQRKYKFDHSKIMKRPRRKLTLSVTRLQLEYETQHLIGKLKLRDPERYERFSQKKCFSPHPMFRAVAGPIEPWEKIT